MCVGAVCFCYCSAFSTIFKSYDITTVSNCIRAASAHICSAVSLLYHIWVTWLDTTPVTIHWHCVTDTVSTSSSPTPKVRAPSGEQYDFVCRPLDRIQYLPILERIVYHLGYLCQSFFFYSIFLKIEKKRVFFFNFIFLFPSDSCQYSTGVQSWFFVLSFLQQQSWLNYPQWQHLVRYCHFNW